MLNPMRKRNPELVRGRVHLVSGYRGMAIKTNDNSGGAKFHIFGY
jgi:hypothetical protein